jgi:hypothetical protein
LRIAELGFFGVVVYTRVHTPRFCGEPCNAGTVLFSRLLVRALRTSWFTVVMLVSRSLYVVDDPEPRAAPGAGSSNTKA